MDIKLRKKCGLSMDIKPGVTPGEKLEDTLDANKKFKWCTILDARWDETLDVKIDVILNPRWDATLDTKLDAILDTNMGSKLGTTLGWKIDEKNTSTRMQH